MTGLKIVCAGQPTTSDRNIAKIADFLGVPSFFSRPGSASQGDAAFSAATAHWKTLQSLAMPGLLRSNQPLFVYGWDGSAAAIDFLRKLTGDALIRNMENKPGTHRIAVAPDSSAISRQCAGLEFDAASAGGGVTFQTGPRADAVKTIICRDGAPSFVQMTVSGATLFLLGQEAITDLDASAPADLSVLPEFERLMPLMMFIRHCFGGQCWQAPVMRACFIIDDPLLRPRYGFLDYHKLLESMERRRFAACIAFIPWNYRRTDLPTADFFLKHSDRFSICVHGCDHTSGEFCGDDKGRLGELTQMALWRMERHQRASGLPFAPVMVFPQGAFSTRAMEVLAESRFLAGVNTSPYPVDCQRGCLTLRETLEPAITRFSNFPILTRRYPRSLPDCVMDLFVGKPLLLVEHHDYFRNGCGAAEEFVSKLNAVEPQLQWTDLDTICSQVSLTRTDERGARQILFYTDRFSLTVGADGLPSTVLFRRASAGAEEATASINGQSVDAQRVGEYLTIPISLTPLARAEIVLERHHPAAQEARQWRGLMYATRVLLRRAACEFRDNVLAKSPWASRVAAQSLKLLQGSR